MTANRHRGFERKLWWRMALTVAPALFATSLLLLDWQYEDAVRWALLLCVLLMTAAGWISLRRYVFGVMRSVASMLEAIREGDVLQRGRYIERDDALGNVIAEVNKLSKSLLEKRAAVVEATLLLDKLVAQVDIAVFAFDSRHRLKRLNKAGANLLADSEQTLLGRPARLLGLSNLLGGERSWVESLAFPGRSGLWQIRYQEFREGGEQHHLVVIADVGQVLRAHERDAWRRIIRVMGHEINNSLTPIRSMAESLLKSLAAGGVTEEWRADASKGLDAICDRSDALSKFISEYAKMARMPPPSLAPVDFSATVRQAASIFKGAVVVEPGPNVTVEIDADQLKQVLINLLKNGVEASQGGEVRIRWQAQAKRLVIEIEDDGCGLATTDSLWVPFYTTKSAGTGLGLAFSRQVVEGHDGTISLQNRSDGPGCLATIQLPLRRSSVNAS